jgi:tRNA threonylcarbamoyladenosine biosynthesis protein TsaB
VVTVLAFDSAGNGCSAAVVRQDRILARRATLATRGQAETLIPMIATVLDEAELALSALDLIAVTLGPGAFTGLRIGLAAAYGLSLATELPVVGVTSFSAVAAQVPAAVRAGRALVVALDSRRAEPFVQVFGADGVPRGKGALVPPAAIPTIIPNEPLILAGDAAPIIARALGGSQVAIAPGPGTVDAVDVARLAVARWRPGLHLERPAPLYLHAPDTTAPGGEPSRQ